MLRTSAALCCFQIAAYLLGKPTNMYLCIYCNMHALTFSPKQTILAQNISNQYTYYTSPFTYKYYRSIWWLHWGRLSWRRVLRRQVRFGIFYVKCVCLLAPKLKAGGLLTCLSCCWKVGLKAAQSGDYTPEPPLRLRTHTEATTIAAAIVVVVFSV